MSRRVVVVAPTPPYPIDRPSRARVALAVSFLAAEGFAIDLVLYPTDPEFADVLPDLDAAWLARAGGSIHIVPPSVATKPGGAGWWDPALDLHLGFLFRRRRYDLMWVTDAVLGAAFSHAPDGCLTVLDTRGTMSDRDGIPGRADILLSEMSRHAPRWRGRQIVPLPVVPDVPRRARAKFPGPTLRVGFIGGDSPLNAATLRRLLQRLDALAPEIRRRITIVVAGTVCRSVRAVPGLVETLGNVPSLAHFYGAIDVAVAPFAAVPGPRLQVNEALAWGVPLIATAVSSGRAAADPFHALPDIDAVVACLETLTSGRARFHAAAAAADRAAAALRIENREGLAALRRAISSRQARLIIITDVPFWKRENFAEERGWQCVAYFARGTPVTVLSVAAGQHVDRDAAATTAPVGVHLALFDDWAEVRAAVLGIVSREAVGGCLISLARPRPAAPPGVPVFHDRWPARAMASRHTESVRCLPDLVLDDGTAIAAAAFHHLPLHLDWRVDANAPPLVLAVIEREADASLVDALWGVCPTRLVVMRSPAIATDALLLASLRAIPRPRAIVTIETSALARELMASLARQAGAVAFHLDGFGYPCLIGDRLIRNLGEHVAAIGAWLGGGDRAPGCEHGPGHGWSRLWRRFATGPMPAPRASSRSRHVVA